MNENNFNNDNMMMNNMMNMIQMQHLKKELILKLVNQNNTLANLIEKNNSKIKKMVENQDLDNNDYEYFNNEIYYLDFRQIDFFPNYNCDRINIAFENDSGLTITMFTPKYAPVKELLKAFYIKLQIIQKSKSQAIHDLKDYYFIYNGSRLSLDEKRTISEYGFLSNSKIVFGKNINVIGGK